MSIHVHNVHSINCKTIFNKGAQQASAAWPERRWERDSTTPFDTARTNCPIGWPAANSGRETDQLYSRCAAPTRFSSPVQFGCFAMRLPYCLFLCFCHFLALVFVFASLSTFGNFLKILYLHRCVCVCVRASVFLSFSNLAYF